MGTQNLNAVYSSAKMRRRYESWFLRIGLADRRGAWWFRYLLLSPGRGVCGGNSLGMPVQVWATWFARGEKPRSFIQSFGLEESRIAWRGASPFQIMVERNAIDDHSCRGDLNVDGHRISWNLNYRSTFAATLSNKGWIGFSRTPHSDGAFSGRITLDDVIFEGEPLGYGVQGHNCGYRHRSFWTWTHAYFHDGNGQASTLEALVYDLPFGMTFRKGILWHRGKRYCFRLSEVEEDRDQLCWSFVGKTREGIRVEASIDGRGVSRHTLPYRKTNGSGEFVVLNNSLASARARFVRDGVIEELETTGGAVLEMAGKRKN